MRLSKRITNLTGGGSDGWDVFRRARAMEDAGKPVINLTLGDHDIPTDPDQKRSTLNEKFEPEKIGEC